MSFSSEVKDELFERLPSSRHCRIAELTAILIMTNGIQAPYICVKSENFRIVKKFTILIYRLFQIPAEVRVRIHKTGSGITTYAALVPEIQHCRQIMDTCKLTESGQLDRLIVQKDCCKRAFIRGAFLTNGSVNNPERSYHYEITCEQEKMAAVLQELFISFDVDAKIVNRKRHYVVYVKEASMIVDALNIMEAHKALMEMESVRVMKDMRNHINRKVNCDMANINKIVTTAARQIEDIRYIEQTKGLQFLKKNLRDVAELRLEEPDMSLQELGENLYPPVSKSGVNHRLKKISEIADELRSETGKK
ncbi:MAG: DNA-binding protein WhiA [Lachnospiraceae bacterium]|nr:DNA-binding protein WhiA [Lachnospiraceae bacterium]